MSMALSVCRLVICIKSFVKWKCHEPILQENKQKFSAVYLPASVPDSVIEQYIEISLTHNALVILTIMLIIIM